MKKLLFLFGLLLTTLAFGQHGNFTDLRLINGDSVLAGTNNGTIYYDRTLHYFRFRENSTWSKLSGTYSGSSPTTITVGGLSSGSAISGLSIQSILESILVPYVSPVFTSFSITGQATQVENGTTLSGAKTWTWSMTLNSGVVPTIDLYNNTTSSTLLAGTANDGTQSQTITTVQLNTPGATQSWKGIGNNTSPVSTFNSSNFVVTSWYLQFWGPVSSTVTNSATIRALGSSSFHTGAMSFTMNTGTTLIKFDVAIPPGSTITSIIDTDALGADVTSSYVSIGPINVTDAGGTSRSYPVYEMTIGVPYSTNHHHVITVN